ncbi:MAG: pilus assembly protein [Anaerolineae bacterium]|nr:pilus assembly protein [Anaerolineae bacterium]
MRLTLRKVVAVLDGQPTGMKGQSLVEMAFTFPILILMILGVAEIGFLANNVLTLLDVVREASRRAVTLDPRTWNADDGVSPARMGERLDCDITNNTYALTLGTVASPDRTGAGKGRNTQFGGLPGYIPGFEPISGEFGFFDGIACYAISIMEPMVFDDTPTGKDDIVVSAISYAMMNYSGDLAATGYDDSVIAPGRIALRTTNSQNAYWVTVTGRWPLENRFCRANSDASLNDERDPFDYLRTSNLLKVRTHNFVPGYLPVPYEEDVTNSTPRQRNELAETDLNGNLMEPAKYVLTDGQQQGVRGYAFTGKMRNEDNAGCYGSKWTVQAIEQKLNYDLATKKALLQEKFSNGGIVLVEMQWQYHPFFLGRIWNDLRGVFWRGDNLAENDPILYVYSMFPVTSIEPTATP